MSDSTLTGVVLITGANRGIGLALTEEFLNAGCRVLAACRRPHEAERLASLKAGYDADRCSIIKLDVADPASASEARQEVRSLTNRVDVLINNAAVHPEEGDESFADLDISLFKQAFETNVYGAASVAQAFLPLLAAGKRPRIVNVSSGAGSISMKTNFTRYCYSASKAALNMLTRCLANELGGKGFTIVAMSPGWVRTDMGGPNAELTPEETARSMAKSILNLKPSQNGQFLNRFGESGVYQW